MNEYGKEKNKQLLRQTLKFIIEETAELQNAVTAQVAGKATGGVWLPLIRFGKGGKLSDLKRRNTRMGCKVSF